MALPTSGPLTLSDIQTEFGGSNPAALSEYYAGGAYVPSGTTGTYGAVPSSGAIGIQNFYGTTSLVINFTDASVSVGPSYFTASAGYAIAGVTSGGKTIGNVYTMENGVWAQYEQWITPTSAAGDYEVYASYTGSGPLGSAVNTWVACSGNPEWYIQVTGNDSATSILSLQVRKVGTGTVLDTWTANLYAESYV